jgi:PAS domain S-box-containing protein
MPKFDTSTGRITSVVLRYGLAVLSVAAAFSITQLLRTYFEPTPNSLFFCAIVASSWFGGLGPGLLSGLLSVGVIDYYFIFPRYTLGINPEDVPRLAVFLVSAASISWLSGGQRRAKESLRQARDELETKVQDRTAELRRANEELQAEIAERKEAEQALLSSEAQLKQAQAVAHLGSYDVDVLTGHTRWSEEVFRILGLDPASGALSRRDFVERVVHPEDREYAMQRYDRVVHEGKLYDLEYRVIRPDGSVRFVQSMGEPIRNPDGVAVRLVGALLDITERKQTEDNLARLNRTLQTLYQCNQALVHATDEYELLQTVCRILVEVGRVRMAWVGYRELDAAKTVRPVAQAGYDQGYVESVKATWADSERGQGPTGTAIRTGKPSWTNNIKIDPSIAPWRAEALKRGYCSNISLPLMSDGEPFGALTLYAEEPNAFNERTVEQFTELANNLAYGVIALRTREERKRAEKELQKQTAYLDELFELAPEAIVLRGVDNRVVRVNQEFTRVFGYTSEEAVGQLFMELITPPDELRDVAKRYGYLLEHGQRVEAETIRQRKDGTRLHVSFVAAPVSVSGGQIAVYAIYRDITERKQAEASLREARAELAHVTRVTTMGELAASIAHEVNQPLAAVVTNANACLRWLAGPIPNPDEARAAALRIIRDGKRASDVIGRIRALVKKSGTEQVRLDINEVIQEVVGLIQSEIQKNGVALRLELAADFPRVLGDRVQLQQVILNLVMNGIEAMSAVTDRSRDLLIRSCPYESDKVLVAVQDSGTGLETESLDHLFTAFFTTKPKGMGMGLAISRSIVENHGGKLWASPNDGPGATFQFTLHVGSKEEEA